MSWGYERVLYSVSATINQYEASKVKKYGEAGQAENPDAGDLVEAFFQRTWA
jgi:hypothetical protein